MHLLVFRPARITMRMPPIAFPLVPRELRERFGDMAAGAGFFCDRFDRIFVLRHFLLNSFHGTTNFLPFCAVVVHCCQPIRRIDCDSLPITPFGVHPFKSVGYDSSLPSMNPANHATVTTNIRLPSCSANARTAWRVSRAMRDQSRAVRVVIIPTRRI